jgi:ribosomal protein L34
MGFNHNRRISRIKKKRVSGFRQRMKTRAGREIINGRRRNGCKKLTPV